MKRAADRELSQPVRLPPQTHPQPPQGRTSANGQTLDSLAEPVRGTAAKSLFAVLQDALDADSSPLTAAAVEAIHMLDLVDDPQQADEAVCRYAAHLLLSLDQPRLLCRLAEVMPIHYVLEVHMAKNRADVLAVIGASWPREATVEIHLSTHLRAVVYVALREFLLRPAELDVTLTRGFAEDKAGMASLAQVLKLRPLNGFTLDGERFEPDILTPLVGVAAHAVVLGLCCPSDGARPQQEDALVALLSKSGAVELDLSGVHIRDALALRLLSCRAAWDRVVMDGGKAFLEWQALDQGRVGQLEWHPSTVQGGECWGNLSINFLRTLHAAGVHTLNVHGFVDLCAAMHVMELYAREHNPLRFLEEFSGCFWVSDDVETERLVALHRYNRRFNAMVHVPSHTAAHIQGYHQIDDDTVARLNAINRSSHAIEDPGRDREIERVWPEAVQAIGALLAPGRTLPEVCRYLKAPPQWVVPAVQINDQYDDWSPTSSVLLSKLLYFNVSGLRSDKLREAIGLRLRAEPDLIPDMCQAVIQVPWNMRDRRPDAWQDLGHRYERRWLSEGMNATLVSDASPVVPAWQPTAPSKPDRLVQLPQVPNTDLVEPGNAHGVAQLDRRMQEIQAQPDNFAELSAARLIRTFLATGAIDPALLNDRAASKAASMLMALGQVKLLRHIVPAHTVWQMPFPTPANATALKGMAPWPDKTSRCLVNVQSLRGAQGVLDIATLAHSMAPEQLGLGVYMDSHADASFWNELATLVKRREGLTFGLFVGQAFSPDAEAWNALTGFLTQVHKTPVKLKELLLDGFADVPPAVEDAIVAVINSSRIDCMSVNRVSDPFARRVMACRPWRRLWIEPTRAMAGCVLKGAVHAETLRLNLRLEHAWEHTEDVVRACKGLKAIEFEGGPVNILALARLLDKNPSITAIKCALEMDSHENANEALALLQRNKSLIRIEENKDVGFLLARAPRLDMVSWVNLFRLVNGNRLFRPELVGRGAGRGFGLGLKNRHGLGSDVFEHMGSFLDLRSALALSATSKSAYAGSRRGMETEIDKLADLLAPQVSFDAFSADMQARLNAGMLVGDPPRGPYSPFLFHDKLRDMRRAGVPHAVIVQVLGRRLASVVSPADTARRVLSEEEGAHLMQLLETLAFVGEIPPRVWLEKGLGIDVTRREAEEAQPQPGA